MKENFTEVPCCGHINLRSMKGPPFAGTGIAFVTLGSHSASLYALPSRTDREVYVAAAASCSGPDDRWLQTEAIVPDRPIIPAVLLCWSANDVWTCNATPMPLQCVQTVVATRFAPTERDDAPLWAAPLLFQSSFESDIAILLLLASMACLWPWRALQMHRHY